MLKCSEDSWLPFDLEQCVQRQCVRKPKAEVQLFKNRCVDFPIFRIRGSRVAHKLSYYSELVSSTPGDGTAIHSRDLKRAKIGLCSKTGRCGLFFLSTLANYGRL